MEIREIKLKNFGSKIGDRILFENMNITLKNGKYHLIGRNGTGKSTLFNNIFLLNKKYSGQILIDGKDIKKIGKKKLRTEYIRYAGQEDKFSNSLSVMDNLNIYTEDDEQLEIMLEKLHENLNIDISQKMGMLSGGERQYINVLLCLTSRAPICFIDEPYNNLSINKIKMIEEAIEQSDKFLFLVDHRELKMANILKVEKRKLVWGE